MVAVRSQDADRFLASPSPHVFVYLIYGTDAGLISERTDGVLRKVAGDPNSGCQITELSPDMIAADPYVLVNEAASMSLFGGRRAITIAAGSKSIVNAIEAILKYPPQNCAIVIGAGALKRDSALRMLVERDRTAAAIECSPDGPKEIGNLIQEMTIAAGRLIETDARALLAGMLGSDRLTTRGEIDKLLLYTHGAKSININDIEASVADQSVLAIDAAVNGAFLGDKQAVDETVHRLFHNGGDVNMLLLFVLRHAIALQQARLEMEGGSSLDQAVQNILRGSSSSRKDLVSRQLRLWTAARLTQTIARVVETIAVARRETRLAEVFTVRTLWAIVHATDSAYG